MESRGGLGIGVCEFGEAWRTRRDQHDSLNGVKFNQDLVMKYAL